MKNIYEILEMMRPRPQMFLGQRSLTALSGFIGGYFCAMEENGILIEEENPSFSQFHDWVARYYKWYESTAGWKNIILREVGDEAKACDVFFELLELFKQRFPVLKYRVFLNQNHKSTGAIYRRICIDGIYKDLDPPKEIRIVQYTTDSGFYRFDVSQAGEISEIGYFETENLVMEEVKREFEVSLDEWETLNNI
ncbi:MULTISPECIES: hypothetical protein [unclassified Nostoc]|uniref:hypothetical protein n=1 Tax=unclassified Nostoc TaxID=2593658 RepID=UPI0025AA5AFE|nr:MULTISPECIES: hypothetical protein [unclassified Nostoc]MDM9585591.1 hypothetical protein [Nostoc sp. GT001]MDZ7946529.1 hypothetical protein [Nostoc sp. EfeVER01]MDZ7996040.1 hypothetical protein [Nostoc sp. EspVER01]